MLKTDILIIGGGITGLSVASFLGNEEDYLILEGGSELGGYCKTTIRNGFVWDYSGHFFHFRNKEIKDYIMANMDCEVVEVEKITDIDYKGTIVDFPFQYNINQLPKEDFLECLIDMYNVGEVDNNNFKSYVNSSLGQATSEKFLIPYNEKLYATDLNNLDANAMGRFFPKNIDFKELMDRMAKTSRYKSYNDTFIYPVNGSYEFVKAILKTVDETKIMTDTFVGTLDLENKIAHTSRGPVKFNKLVSTMPFNKLLATLGRHSEDLTSNKVAVFNLGFNKGTNIKTHWRYFPGKEVFYRIGFYNNILGQDKMSLYVEIGATTNQELNEEELLRTVLKDLKSSKIITDHVLTDHQFIVMDPAYVHITKKSESTYNYWSDLNNSKGIYSIGRYGSWTYCSIEDNIIQAKELAKKLRNKTTK
jgi:protoporphyrinogen oxidase